MAAREASRTAVVTAHLRAAHQLLDAEPRVLDDPFAVPLLGPDAPQRIHAAIDRFQTPTGRALRSHVVLRSRFAEDRLAMAVERGVRQYVILGAGLDTFALRQPSWAAELRIVELDHPATQELKRRYLTAAGLALPANVLLAPVDFAHESLADSLRRHGVALDQPTLYSWLGVTMYLQREAIDAALRDMAAFAAGSETVLTYLSRPDATSPAAVAAAAEMAQHVADSGEPFVSYFEPDEIATTLRAAGFAEVVHLSAAEADERYFRSRPADLPAPRRTGICAALC